MFNSYSEDFCHYAALTEPIDPNVIIDLLLSVVHPFLSPGYPDFLVLVEEASLVLAEVKANAVGEERRESENLYLMDLSASKYCREAASKISFSLQYATPFCH